MPSSHKFSIWRKIEKSYVQTWIRPGILLDLLVYCIVLALHILFCCYTHVQWNLDITSLYITKSSGITNDFPDPSNSKVYEKEPRYSEENLSVPWPFVASRFHCNTIWNNSQVFFFFHYPHPLWGFSRIMKQIIESQLVGGKQDGYFKSVVVNLHRNF